MTIDLRTLVGNPRGRNADKNHRVAKLMKEWKTLRAKMEGMVKRGHAGTDTSLCAYATLLIMETGIRVGNEESAEGFECVNKHHPLFGQVVTTYGVTTLQNRHVTEKLGGLVLEFCGKKLVDQNLFTGNPTLVKYRPKAGPADVLWLGVTDAMLRKFVKRYVGRAFTPKDIRRTFVNILFCDRFHDDYEDSFLWQTKKSERNKVVRTCIEDTAATVGHTPGVCRSAYLSHPMLDALKSYAPAK